MLRALFSGRRLIATLVVLLGVATNFGLSYWQYTRHLERVALNARVDERMVQPALPLDRTATNADALDYRRVSATGTYDPAQEIVLRNRSYAGELGVHILTPLRLPDGAAVLVDRGWVPINDGTPERRARYAPPTGTVMVEGVARKDQADLRGPDNPALQPGQTRLDAWFTVDTARIGQQAGYPLLPIFIELQPDPNDPNAVPARVKTSGLGEGSHLNYTVQWAGFGIAMLVVYVAWVYQAQRRAEE